jgi:hypothetical protein
MTEVMETKPTSPVAPTLPAVLLAEFQRRHLHWQNIPDTDVFIIKKGQRRGFIIQSYLPTVPYNIGLILSNKNFVREILAEKKIAIPIGQLIAPNGSDEAATFVQNQGWPVVVRQENSQLNIAAITNIGDHNALQSAIRQLSRANESLLIEQYIAGEVFQVFITESGYCHILEEQRVTMSNDSAISFSTAQTVTGKKVYQETVLSATLYRKMQVTASKVLAAFPPLAYLSLRLIVDRSARTPRLIVTDVYHTVTPHLRYAARRDQERKLVSSLVADYVEKALKPHATF